MSRDTMKVYIAAPFFNERQLDAVKSIEDLLDKEGIEYFSPRSEGTLQEMTPEERAYSMTEVFKSNVSHMDWATHVVAYTDDRDMGTVWELGYCYANGKHTVTYTSNNYGINVMINESIFTHCKDLEQIIPALLGQKAEAKTEDVT